MNKFCEKLVNRIASYDSYKEQLKISGNKDLFIEAADTISQFRRNMTPVVIEDVRAHDNNILNISAMLELIDIASSEISVYSDNINPNTLGHSLIVDNLILWLSTDSNRKLKILLKTDCVDKKSYFYTKIKEKEGIQKQVIIRHSTKNISGGYHILIADSYAYKIKFDTDNRVLLAFDDIDFLAEKFKIIFDRHFNKDKNSTPIKTDFIALNFINRLPNLDFIGLLEGAYKLNIAYKYKGLNGEMVSKESKENKLSKAISLSLSLEHASI